MKAKTMIILITEEPENKIFMPRESQGLGMGFTEGLYRNIAQTDKVFQRDVAHSPAGA